MGCGCKKAKAIKEAIVKKTNETKDSLDKMMKRIYGDKDAYRKR